MVLQFSNQMVQNHLLKVSHMHKMMYFSILQVTRSWVWEYKIFENTNIQTRRQGQRHLGPVIGTTRFVDVSGKMDS